MTEAQNLPPAKSKSSLTSASYGTSTTLEELYQIQKETQSSERLMKIIVRELKLLIERLGGSCEAVVETPENERSAFPEGDPFEIATELFELCAIKNLTLLEKIPLERDNTQLRERLQAQALYLEDSLFALKSKLDALEDVIEMKLNPEESA
jgi:hypothetical protein